MVTIACVQVGNYCGRGAEYVNRLRDAVLRHLPQAHRFVCLTDNASGYNDDVEPIQALPGLTGWWQKLALFAPATFREDERVIYFDLDTWIRDDITPLAEYRGDFAMLQHLMRPGRGASGVLAWRAGGQGARAVWAARERVDGEPSHVKGDQGFIEDELMRAKVHFDLLQRDVASVGIYSYKIDVLKRGMPRDARVICFHGQPRPHDVPHVWRAMY